LDVAENAGISLQVSGHTHAGQFLPFSLLVRMIYGRFGYGLHRHGSLHVVTSSGAGTGGPPFRIGTRSEIVMLRLRAVSARGDPTVIKNPLGRDWSP
jgi:predicted MPP superfamily phosphohydrolase